MTLWGSNERLLKVFFFFCLPGKTHQLYRSALESDWRIKYLAPYETFTDFLAYVSHRTVYIFHKGICEDAETSALCGGIAAPSVLSWLLLHHSSGAGLGLEPWWRHGFRYCPSDRMLWCRGKKITHYYNNNENDKSVTTLWNSKKYICRIVLLQMKHYVKYSC